MNDTSKTSLTLERSASSPCGGRAESSLARARELLASHGGGEVAKAIWSSPAGKSRIAQRLASLLPYHRTYVEPFAGSAAVFFVKRRAPTEVLNDLDPEITRAYQLIQRMTPEDSIRLSERPWVADVETYKALQVAQPETDVDWLHRFLYLSNFSYRRKRGHGFAPDRTGVRARSAKRIELFGPRLAGAKIHNSDYEPIVRKYDSRDTVFFMDPPYAGYNVGVGEAAFDQARFLGVLKSVKGKFLATIGVKGTLPAVAKAHGFWVKRIRTARSSPAGWGYLTQVLVANYDPLAKSLDGQDDLEDWMPEDEPPASRTFRTTGRLLKGVNPDDERYVLGVVLEPEVVDAQGDVYSAAEIRQAAHRFMEEFGTMGLMHRVAVGDQVKIVETYLAPVDFSIEDSFVRGGTWLLGVRVLSDQLWERVRSGEITGFSIGGSAERVVEPNPPDENEGSTAANNERGDAA